MGECGCEPVDEVLLEVGDRAFYIVFHRKCRACHTPGRVVASEDPLLVAAAREHGAPLLVTGGKLMFKAAGARLDRADLRSRARVGNREGSARNSTRTPGAKGLPPPSRKR